MNRKFALAGLAAWLAAASAGTNTYADSRTSVAVRYADDSLGVSFFYDDLASYGSWVDYGPYGSCWVPADVSPTWRPYEDGTWVLTDYGWTWASNEPWGWATYHYGRWEYDSDYGRVWIPGSVWAPAWVAWHCGDDWVGWAPLPPDAGWQTSVGLRFASVSRIPAANWCFVPRERFCDNRLRTYVVPAARNEWLIGRTRDATRYEVRDGRPVNRGVDVAYIEQGQRKKIRQLRLVDADSPRSGRGHPGRDSIALYRPRVRDEDFRSGPPQGKHGRELPTAAPQVRRKYERQDRDDRQGIARQRERREREPSQTLRKARRPDEAAGRSEQQANERKSFERQAAVQRQRAGEHDRNRVATAEKEKPAKPDRRAKDRRGGTGPHRGR